MAGLGRHERRLDRVERQVGPPTDPPTAEGYAAIAAVAHGIDRTELDRRWPEPGPDADDMDADIYRIVRAEWFRQHPDAQRSAWLA